MEFRNNKITRRDFLSNAFVAATLPVVFPPLFAQHVAMMNKYGLYGKLQAKTGKGPDLNELLLEAAKLMETEKGCLFYIVSRNSDTPDAVYVIEVWDNKEAHDESLKLPRVRELITRAMPLIDGKPEGITLEVLGGKGLS
jgi:quinol monooxygenase YgiN